MGSGKISGQKKRTAHRSGLSQAREKKQKIRKKKKNRRKGRREGESLRGERQTAGAIERSISPETKEKSSCLTEKGFWPECI